MERRVSLNWTHSDEQFILVVLSCPEESHLYELLRPRAIRTIVADGAANCIAEVVKNLGDEFLPTEITGDFDSITDATKEFFTLSKPSVHVIQNPSQENTDFEKCLDLLDRITCSDVVVIGEVGGRVDHSVSVMSVLFKQVYDHLNLFLINQDNLTFVLKQGSTVINLAEVKWIYCSLLPISRPAIVSTSGLHWNLDNQELSMTGLVSSSNKPETKEVRVQSTEKIMWSCYFPNFLSTQFPNSKSPTRS